MEGPVFVALWLFALTHIDTLVVMMAFCADEDYRYREIVPGHFLGFGIGLLIAFLGADLARVTLEQYAFLLGAVPLAMGVWGLRQYRRGRRSREQAVVPGRFGRTGVVTLAGIGLSGENIAAFVPFFVTLSRPELVTVLGLYVVGAAVVLLAAVVLARIAHTVAVPEWVDDLVVPVVLVLVGGYVLASGWLLAASA